MEQRRPLGYWLKLLDQLIEENLNRVLAAQGLHRRHWQTMNLLAPGPDFDRAGRRGPATKEAIAQGLRPFWSGSSVDLDQAIDDLRQRGWITEREPHSLTPEGETAHAALAREVERAGRRIRDGVTAERYADTIEVLRHLVLNAEQMRRTTI
ncbi:MarR family transcriptional regulator [Nonomuraea mesophila]|uniref:MarR family transcriptional regulator n=1 Tax=Nonomuraea mesophila TaxID=2530382 RepID=A0A4R5FXR5_9ACTN|nr:MarR family transcriptional regulator [Nonomuraea mesophila]TDE59664.1 MarR family transcriptional regulator [Nonomuraea mesophila]